VPPNSTFFLGTLYLEHVLHYGTLQTGLVFLLWTITVAALSLGITARLVERFGAMRVLIAGMLTAIVGPLPAHDRRSAHELLPTIFLAYFALGLGIGTAFVPLLTIAMAEVPAADAGLGSGIINVAQQVSGALGLAVLGTTATDRTHALEIAHHSPVGALLSGYHLAFAVGAASVGVGILAALALLRAPGTRRPDLVVHQRSRRSEEIVPELEQQAA
jgi:MFS family permease